MNKLPGGFLGLFPRSAGSGLDGGGAGSTMRPSRPAGVAAPGPSPDRHEPGEIPWVFDDGGRAAAGLPRTDGDCACRAFAIVLGRPYVEVRLTLKLAGACDWADEFGVPIDVAQAYLLSEGWHRTLNQSRESGDYLRIGDLPSGRLVLEFVGGTQGHYAALVDGAVRDLDDHVTTQPVWAWWQEASDA